MNRWIYILIAFAVSSICWASPEGQRRNELLRIALKSADRLEIRDTVGWTSNGKSIDPGPLTVLEQPDVAHDFLRVCVFSDAEILPPCACEGEIRVDFFSGPKLIAQLYVHEEMRIFWLGGPFKGQLPIEPSSKVALMRWFREHGAARELARITQ